MTKISAIINIHNEAHLLRECLESLTNFADEIVISDMKSTDNGAEIAREYGCVVFSVPHSDVVEHTILPRVERATGEWILLFDPDMRMPLQTSTRLKQIVENDEADVVQFFLVNRVFGDDVLFGHGSTGCFTKFFKRQLFLESPEREVRIHSMVGDALKATSARWISLGREYPLIHLAYADLESCFRQHLRYARYEAKERWDRGERFSVYKLLWEPLRKAGIDFVVRQAWRGGMSAMVYSVISELMIFQIHLFLWEKQKRQR